MVNFADSFAGRLRKLREKQGLTQEQLAERLEYKRSTIASCEQGSRMPSVDLLVAIANYFAVDTDYLLGRDKAVTKLDKDKEEIAEIKKRLEELEKQYI